MRFIRRAVSAALTLTATVIAAFALGLSDSETPSVAWGQSVTGTRYTNLVNNRFATVSSGPQSALIVDVPAGASDSEAQARVAGRARSEWEAKSRALAPQAARWEALGLIKPRSVLPLSTVVMERKQGRLVVPPRTSGITRSVGGGTITFRYTGFNDTDKELLQGFAAVAYPRLVAVYGQPAVSGEVEVVNAGNLFQTSIPETKRFAYGVYDASKNQILLPIFQDPRGTLQAFLLNIVHAFHGPAVFQYDAWEQGFSRAAASVVLRDPIFNQQYGIDDASANSLYSLLKYYDILNQPALGNNTFFPPSQADIPIDGQITVAKMLWARIGMSGAVWQKVYIENQNFFSQFNAAYYAQFDPTTNPSVAGNVSALRAIAAPLLPNGVEGTAWDDWFVRQYVLDTSISAGTKLFAFVVPAPKDADGRQPNSVTLVYYRTERSGDETLLSGRGYATYFDAQNARLQFGPQAEQATIGNGEGGLTVTTTNNAGIDGTRLTMDFSVANQTARVYLPAGFDGDFQGVLLGSGLAQSITVNQVTLPPVQTHNQTATLQNYAFGAALGTAGNDLGVTVVQVSDGTATREFRINTGDGLYYAVLRDGTKGGAARTIAKTFNTGSVPYLVSLPVRPFSTDVAQALTLPATDFLLSYWNPVNTGAPAYETFVAGQPSVSPLQPGRGYWLKLTPANNAQQIVVSLTGTPPPTDTSFTVSCPYGWNLVGSPFDQAIPLTDVKVQQLQNDAYTWDEAVSRNLVAAQPIAFDTVSATYAPVDGFGADWQGYWVRVLVPSGVTLILPGPDVPIANRGAKVPLASSSRATSSTARPDWSVRLVAHQETTLLRGTAAATGIGTSTATLGAARGASRSFDNRYDRELPPAIVPSVSVEFTHADWGKAAGGRFVADYRDSASATRGTWDVQVSAPERGPVTLTWDGLGGVPRGTQLALVDKQNGTRVSLRSRSSYSFNSEAGKIRVFQIVAEPTRSQPLSITNIMAIGGRATAATGGGVSLSYSLTGTADVTVDIASLNGGLVRRLSTGRAETAGVRRVHFDGRAQNGNPLPPGPYMLTISARDEDGSVVKATRIITLLQ